MSLLWRVGDGIFAPSRSGSVVRHVTVASDMQGCYGCGNFQVGRALTATHPGIDSLIHISYFILHCWCFNPYFDLVFCFPCPNLSLFSVHNSNLPPRIANARVRNHATFCITVDL